VGQSFASAGQDRAVTTLGDFRATTIDGDDRQLSAYAGQVVLVVNTASRCGFTPQYHGLQQLQDDLAADGFTVLGFPCDQFAHQEPGDEGEIREFCERGFGVTFPMFAKVRVNGAGSHPLFRWLRSEAGGLLGGRVMWNFTKFLVGRDGRVLGRYAPTTPPERIRADIVRALAEEPAA
jgi:glutathione peroxidase